MSRYIIPGLLILFIFSAILAYRSLKELEIPEEIVAKIKKGEKPPKLWGVILFIKGKTVHYSSASASSGLEEEVSDLSSKSSSKISERMDV